MSIKTDINRINLGKEDINMLANRKIVIIGAGHVGSHCAYALAIQEYVMKLFWLIKTGQKLKVIVWI